MSCGHGRGCSRRPRGRVPEGPRQLEDDLPQPASAIARGTWAGRGVGVGEGYAGGRQMRAAWYERQGLATDVVRVVDPPTLESGPGEVRVRLRFSGVNPGDTKKRSGWLGNPMAFPLVVPHSDGAGVAASLRAGAHSGRLGRLVWVWAAQPSRLLGAYPEETVVP